MIYSLSFALPLEVTLQEKENVHSNPLSSTHSRHHSREDALARFNDFCLDLGDDFFGVNEGILLAEEAHDRGYETESWVLDAGMAPHERDWLKNEKTLNLIAYFKTEKAAKQAEKWLLSEYVFLKAPIYQAEEEQDWNATWKASFMGIEVNDKLRVLPPWHEDCQPGIQSYREKGIIAINPGAGFGTGTHETTQLCLQVLTGLGDLTGKRVLDFGSGSGILGIAAALQGAEVDCVEIDPLANDNARENAKLNGVEDQVQISEMIPDQIRGGKVDILIANILRPILLQFAPEIKDCLKPKAELVLSGLIETDLDQVIKMYQGTTEPFKVHRYEKNEWRALWLRK